MIFDRPGARAAPGRSAVSGVRFSAPPEEVADHAARAGNLLQAEAIEKFVGVGPQAFACAEFMGCDGDMHGVDEIGGEELPNGGDASPDAHVPAGGGECLFQGILGGGVVDAAAGMVSRLWRRPAP